MAAMNVKVSLAEALEVRDGPLEEPELWGVLCQAVEAVQDMFLQSAVEGTFSEIMQMLPITSGSLLLCCDGRICIGPSSSTDPPSKEFIPPEYGRSRNLTEEEVEKMFVFSLGMTLLAAANFRLPSDQRMKISQELGTLLSSMCTVEPFLRATLFHVLRTCSNSRHHRKNGSIPSGHFVMKLYQLVLGSSEDVSCWSKESDQGDWSSPSEFRQQTMTGGSRSKVKSRSSSHNVNRQSNHQQKLNERPRTIGRDELSDITRQSVQSEQFSHSHRLLKPKDYGANKDFSRTSNDLIIHQVLEGSGHNKARTISTSKSKKHLQEEDAMKSRNWWQPVFHLNADGVKLFSASTGNLATTETLEHAYNRLNRRRRKLDILRREVHFDGHDVSDVFSLGSDVDAGPNEPDFLHSMTDISNGHRHHNFTTSEADRHLASKKYQLYQLPRQSDRNLLVFESEREKLQRKELEIEQWRKFQMQHLDPLVVNTSSWNEIDTNNQLPPSSEQSQNSTTFSERLPSIRHPRKVKEKTGISSSTVFQMSDHTTSLFHDMHHNGFPVSMSEFETSPSVNSPMHDELSTNHESTPNSPQTLDLNSQARSMSPHTKNWSAVRVHEYEIDSPISFYETLPCSSHPQKLSSRNLSQGLNLAPVQAVEFAVTPPVNEFLSTVKGTSHSDFTESKELINSGMEESKSTDSRLLKEDIHASRHQKSNQRSVDVSNTKSSTRAGTSTTFSESIGANFHQSSPGQVKTKTEAPKAPIKAPRKKSLTPVVALDSYGLSIHETVSASPEISDGTRAKAEVPVKAPRKKSLTPVSMIDTFGVSNTETFSVSPGEASGNGHESETSRKAPPRKKAISPVVEVNSTKPDDANTSWSVLDTQSDDDQSQVPVHAPRRKNSTTVSTLDATAAAASLESSEYGIIVPPDAFRTPAEEFELDGRRSTDRCDQECQTDVAHLKKTEDATSDVSSFDTPVETLTPELTPPNSPKYTADYFISAPNAPVCVLDPVVETPADGQEVKTVVESTVTKPDRIEVFTDSPAQVHANKNVEQYVVTKPDNTEILTDSPAQVHANKNVEQYVVTKPDNREVLTDSPSKMHANKLVEQYVVTKPDNTEVLTDSPSKMHANKLVEQYVVTKPDNTEVLTDSPSKTHANKTVEQYVATKPGSIEMFTDPSSNMNASQNVKPYVLTKPGNTEVFPDSPAKMRTSQNVEPYVVTKPDNDEIFTESPSRAHPSEDVKQYDITKPDNTEVYTESPAKVHTSQNIEQYVVTKPNSTDVFSNTSSTMSEGRNVEQYAVTKPGNTEVFNESLAYHNTEQHDITEPELAEVPASDLPQNVGQYVVAHTDKVEVFSDSVKTPIDSELVPSAQSSVPENVVQSFISIPNSDEVFAYVLNRSDKADLEPEVKPPIKAPRKSLKTPVQELVMPPVDEVDARSTPAVAEQEKQPPPKAPRKLIRTGANDAPSPTMPPPPPPADASGSESERTKGVAATPVVLPGADDLRSTTVEDGADSEVAALTASINDETNSENFRQDSPRSSVKTGVDPRRGSRGTVEGGRRPFSVASEESGQRISRREDHDTLDPAVPKTWKRQDRIVGNKAPRHCYGPEFAHFNNQMVTLIVPESGGVQQADLRHVLVVLLDGVHLDLICSVNSTGRHLYDCVTSYLTLPEQVFFGLVYVEGEEYFFLTADTKIHKVAPVDWKKKSKLGQHQTGTFVLYFRVKFYISDFDQLRHKQTQHLFYLQLRHDLLDESLHCSDELALALGSLAVQAEYGDWYERSAEVDVDQYLAPSVVRHLGKMEAKEALLQQHSRYNGMPDAKAEWLMMQKCAQLPEYGLHFHRIFRSKNTQHETLLVGINLHGVILAVDQGNGRVFTRQHPWHTIYKISFNKHRFSIATKTATATTSEALVKFNYYTSTYKKGQYLVWLSTEHHRFRLLARVSRSARSHSIPSSLLEDEYLMIDGASSAIGSNGSLNLEETTDNEINHNIGKRNENNNNNDRTDVNRDLEDSQSMPGRKQSGSRRERPVSFASGSNSATPVTNYPQRYSLPNDPSGVQSSGNTQDPMIDTEELLDRQSNASSELDLEDVLPHELLHLPHSQRENQPPEETCSQELRRVNAQMYENTFGNAGPRHHPPKSSDDDTLDVDRNLRPGDRYELILRKKENSFGINIAGGTNTKVKMGGVYVKSMTPGGAADRDGRIQVGDRVLRVNGISLVGATHRQAVEILRSSPPTSSLQLERCDPPSVTPSIISSWSSLARSELEVESTDTGIELKSKPGGNGKKMLRGRQVSVSESGINSEPSAYNGDMDLEPSESHADSNNLTRYRNIPDETHSRRDTVNQPGETDVTRTPLNYSQEGSFASRAELREKMFPRRPTLDRRHTVSSMSQPVSATSSFQLPTSPRTASEYNGDVDSSVVGPSTVHTSGQVPYNSDAPRSEYEDVSSGDDDDEEYEHLVNQHSMQAEDEDALGNYETLSEYFPQEDDQGAEATIPEEFDSEFVELNRLAILKDLPEHLSSDWLDELPFISLATGNQLYTGTNLELMIQDLEDRLMRGEPSVEYKSLKQVKLTDFCLDGLNPDNKHKNRYRNILPYDKTRVKLSGPDDYINASHITFSVGQTKHHYLAAQGPLPTTVADFWRMIWEQDVDVVVMLTQEVEGGKVKCDRYWPELSDGPGFLGNLFRVTQMEYHPLPNCIIRFFQMDDLASGASRLITHLNFTTWPDHNTPENGMAILRFVHLMHGVHQSRGPILVHCSAGVGRTGALLTIDICLAMIEQDLKFDIESVARELRHQRHGMIQTQDQYGFCYSTLLGALKSLRAT